MPTSQLWESFVVSGRDALERNHYDEAEALLTLAVMMARASGNCLNNQIALTHCCLGDLYFEQGLYDIAAMSYHNALRLFHVLDSVGVDRAIVTRQLSEVCRLQGNPLEAIRLRYQADRILENRRAQLEVLLTASVANC